MVIPGLLQAPEYARAISHALRPHVSDDQIEQEVDVRMHRQEILHRPNPLALWVILDETVPHRPAVEPEVMRDQYAHPPKMTKLPHVAIQVLPFEAGLHAGQLGAFEILERDDAEEIVRTENHKGGRFFDSREMCPNTFAYTITTGQWRGACVEVALTPYVIGIRDTKNRGQGHLTVPSTAWRTFISSHCVAAS